MSENIDFALKNLIEIADSEWKKVVCNKHKDWSIILLISDNESKNT